MTEKEKKSLTESMKKEGFSQEEMDKVFRGIEDVEEGRILTPEEVYASLFHNKEVIHA